MKSMETVGDYEDYRDKCLASYEKAGSSAMRFGGVLSLITSIVAVLSCLALSPRFTAFLKLNGKISVLGITAMILAVVLAFEPLFELKKRNGMARMDSILSTLASVVFFVALLFPRIALHHSIGMLSILLFVIAFLVRVAWQWVPYWYVNFRHDRYTKADAEYKRRYVEAEAEYQRQIREKARRRQLDEDEAQRRLRRQAYEQAKDRLDRMIGLSEVKDWLHTWESNIRFDQESGKNNGRKPDMNFVFYGDPGTGKTEVARLMGDLLYGLGLLDRSDVVSTDRTGLVGQHIGDTEAKTTEVINKAMGGTLFVDEAYMLTQNAGDGDFGPQAYTKIMTTMEDSRGEIAVIFAGYKKDMQQFLDYNQGMRSRIPPNNYITFEDYDLEEMYQITVLCLSELGFVLDMSDGWERDAMHSLLTAIMEGSMFSNGRSARQLAKYFDDHRGRIVDIVKDDNGMIVLPRNLFQMAYDDMESGVYKLNRERISDQDSTDDADV